MSDQAPKTVKPAALPIPEHITHGPAIPMRIKRAGQDPAATPPSQRLGRAGAPASALQGFSSTLTGQPTGTTAATKVAHARRLMADAARGLLAVEQTLPGLLAEIPAADAAALSFDIKLATDYAAAATTALDILRD